MSQTGGGNTERWPIAPDGYIPNSVIRSWRKKKKKHLPQTDPSDDVFSCLHQEDVFSCLHREDEDPTNDQEDLSTRVLRVPPDEDEENTGDVKARKKESKDEEKKAKVEGRKVTVRRKESYVVQTKISLQNQQKTSDDGRMNVEPQGQEGSYDSRTTVPTSCHANKQLREREEEPPLQHLNDQRTSSFFTNAWPPVGSPVVSDVLSKQEPKITSYIPPIKPQNLNPHPPKPPSPILFPNPQPQSDRGPHPSLTPEEPQLDRGPHPSLTPEDPQSDRGPHPSLTPEDLQSDHGPYPLKPPSPTPVNPQPQPDLEPPEVSPIRDKRFLLSSTKYDNIRKQTQVPLNRRVLDFYKKFKAGTKNSSCLGKYSITKRPLASPHSTVQSNSGGLRSEWMKNLHYPFQGFCSPPAAIELPVKSSNVGQLAAIIPSLRASEAPTHQRVVQRIRMEDTLDPPSFHFRHVIPLNAQQTFYTLNPGGKTRYGRLQFDWLRGNDEGKLWLRPTRLQLASYDLTRST